MNKNLKSCAKISDEVCAALEDMNLTLEKCVHDFNTFYKNELQNSLFNPINKDFIQRIKSCKYKVVNDRVVRLCRYLSINPYEEIQNQHVIKPLNDEFAKVEKLVLQKPELTAQVCNLLQSIIKIACV